MGLKKTGKDKNSKKEEKVTIITRVSIFTSSSGTDEHMVLICFLLDLWFPIEIHLFPSDYSSLSLKLLVISFFFIIVHIVEHQLLMVLWDWTWSVKWLNFQLVLGGPFLSKIEHILRGKASLMGSPVVSASDPGNRSVIKGISNICGKPCQSCDIVLEIDRDIKLVHACRNHFPIRCQYFLPVIYEHNLLWIMQFIELLNVNLCMLGPHQLQNAATATCAALCLRHQGEDSMLFLSPIALNF